MNANITTKPELGKGMYTIPDAAVILDLPGKKMRRWIKKYGKMEFAGAGVADSGYTWGERREKAFNFYTLIELMAVHSFRETGVSFRVTKAAHEKLSKFLDTAYPFAHSDLFSDGKRLYYEYDSLFLELSEKQQFSFKRLILQYCQKIDFHNTTHLATRYWPLGKGHNIIVDPRHRFGQPVIEGTNIEVHAIINMLRAGEEPGFIASVYGLTDQQIEDARQFMKRLAA